MGGTSFFGWKPQNGFRLSWSTFKTGGSLHISAGGKEVEFQLAKRLSFSAEKGNQGNTGPSLQKCNLTQFDIIIVCFFSTFFSGNGCVNEVRQARLYWYLAWI